MLLRSFLVTLTAAPLIALAQYGSFAAPAVKAAKALPLVVVLDAGDSPYNRALMNAVKAEWKFNASVDFITVADLGMQPISADRTYLMKTRRTDPVKFEGSFMAVVKGWKQKKGDALQQTDNCFTGIGAEQELASILIDPKAIADGKAAAMITIYVKHLQDYLKQVEGGKVIDMATADRLYASRTRLVRETELLFSKEHLDKSLPGAEAIKAVYTSPFRIGDAIAAIEAQDRTKTVSDAVITIGDHKNKHCFKRVFNAGTGELMYLRDDAAIFGKKEGFIEEDLKALERAR
ncbi:MAG: hypothetical protein IPK70_02235 [Flavobacteriales bacterium]|nr:hypothetical protein [Flavobacteriales bacterium]